MPITIHCDASEIGAYCVFTSYYGPYTKETVYKDVAHGRTLALIDCSNIDYSIWDALLWDDVKREPVRLRHVHGVKEDATPETLAAYKAWEVYQARLTHIRHMMDLRAQWVRIAKACGLPHYTLARKLIDSLPYDVRARAMTLLTAKLRSSFRISLRKQMIDWAMNPTPKHRCPLSPKQLNYI